MIQEQGNSQEHTKPTFGSLKAGDPNPFVVGMEVIYGSDHRAIVRKLLDGPSVVLEWENKVVGTYGFALGGGQRNRNVHINTIFPTTQEQPAPHEFKFGDKVKVGGYNIAKYFFAKAGGRIAFCNVPPSDIGGSGPATTFTIPSDLVTPWPDPVTLPLTEDYKATLTEDGVLVGCQLVSYDAFDNLAKAVKEYRA